MKRKAAALSAGESYLAKADKAYQASHGRARRVAALNAMDEFADLNLRTGGRMFTAGSPSEIKNYDTKLVRAVLSATSDAKDGEHDESSTVCFNTVAQGNGATQRDGRVINMHKLQIRGIIEVDQQVNTVASWATKDEASVIYIAIVEDKQTNATQIVSENVFENKGAATGLASCPFRKLENVKRFRVLKQHTIQLPLAQGSSDGTNVYQPGYSVPWSSYIDLNGLATTFKTGGTTSTIANIQDVSLHLLAWTNNTALAPRISYNARLRFTG